MNNLKNLIFIGISLLALAGCSNDVKNIDAENIMQINDVGLREGVFIRRFKITSEFSKHQIFSPEILKKFIQEKLEPDYLFMAHARELGYQNEPVFKQNFKDYRVNLIAGANPVYYPNQNISENALQELYKKKSISYNVNVIMASSYSMADSVYKILQSGKKIKDPNEIESAAFPKVINLRNLSFGEGIHPELMPRLPELKEGEFTKPVFTSPIWSILQLNGKRKRTGLPPYEKVEGALRKQSQMLISFKNKKSLLGELRKKYKPFVRDSFFPILIAAFIHHDSQGYIDGRKINTSDLKETFIKINNDDISLADYIFSFNKGIQFMQFDKLTNEDLRMLVGDYIDQNLLYFDAIEKGIDQNAMIKDKLTNKENRSLLTKYLKEQIGNKIVIDESDVRRFYEDNREDFIGEYEDVEVNVKSKLRSRLLNQRKEELVNMLRDRYTVLFNDTLLNSVASQLTAAKSAEKNEDVL
jgi:hypothetical protein